MKKYIFFLSIVFLTLYFTSCSEDDLSKTSVIVDENTKENNFDKWILFHYTTPYNIEFKYRFEDLESDMNYNLEAADYHKSVRMAKLIEHLILGTYDEVTGSSAFLRSYFPKILFMVGSPAYKNNGTIILATAENGYKISINNVNSIPLTAFQESNIPFLNTYYFKTLHHEFAHILHQTKPYPTSFKEISSSNYVQDSWNTTYTTDAAAQKAGFISPYASSSDNEDFVELYSIYVTNTKADWDAKITTAGDTGSAIINSKLDIVKNYMETKWKLNMDQVREVVLRRQSEVLDLDLDSLN